MKIDVEPNAFVTMAYNTVLEREPDPQGQAYYVGALQSGRLRWHDVVRDLLTSDEYRSKLGGHGAVGGTGQRPTAPAPQGALLEKLTAREHLSRPAFEAAWNRRFGPGRATPYVVQQQEYIPATRSGSTSCSTRWPSSFGA